MLITLQQLKSSLQAVKNYINNVMPNKASDLQNDVGYLTQHQDISGKQDTLTFDSIPTINSANPVTSDGIKTALENVYSLTTGIEIPENSDLNNYTNVGTYYSGATTPLLIDNHPNTTYPFKLFVEDIHTDDTQSYNIKSIRQTIVYDCSPVLVYQRQGTVVDNQKTFGNWQLDSITKVSDLTNDSNFTTQSYVDGEIDSLQTTLSTKANIDGSYDSMAVKESERLASLDFTEDNTPYLFRKSGGDGNEEPVIVGNTVKWNQLVNLRNVNTTKRGVTYSIVDNVITYSGTTEAGSTSYIDLLNVDIINISTVVPGHRYLWLINDSGKTTSRRLFAVVNNPYYEIPNNTLSATTYIWTPNGKPGYALLRLNIGTAAGTTVSGIGTINCFDLTAMFGITIADYIYTLESTTVGSGISWIRKYGYFTKDYYPYSEPTLKHVEGLVSHKMIGFNQLNMNRTKATLNSGASNTNIRNFEFDKFYVGVTSNNYYYESQISSFNVNTQLGEVDVAVNGRAYGIAFPIRCFPNTSYYINTTMSTYGIISIGYYDISGKYISNNTNINRTTITTPSNCYIMTIIFGSNTDGTTSSFSNICINIHYDGSRDGEYERYKEYTYPLNSSVVLRGIPKLDTNNNLYFDGDIYESNETITRNIGEFTFSGSENWSLYETSFFQTWVTLTDGDKKTNGRIITSNGVDVYVYSNGQLRVYLAYNPNITVDTNINALLSSGIKFIYPLATPTTETAAPFQSPQVVDGFGTEEWVFDDNAFPVPVGHETTYRNIVTMQDVKDIQSNIDDIQFDLNNKQDTLTFDSAPTANSTNPVTSGGIKTAIDNIDSGVYIGSTAPTGNQNVWIDTSGNPDSIVEDVQIDGTSIVSNGVANIPIASSSNKGIVGIDSDNGINLTNTNNLIIDRASSAQIKNGTDLYKPLTPINQHEATFYGLAKVAGSDMASSNNAVGTYTNEAKTAIKSMLGIVDECSVVTVSGTTPSITAEENTRYICGEVTSLSFTPCASGICDVRFTSGSTVTVLTIPSTVKFPNSFNPTSLETNKIYEINILDGIYGVVTSWAI